MCCTINILISNWPRTRKSSQLLQARKTVGFAFAYYGHVLVMLYVQFLCSDWSNSIKFMRKIYAAAWILFTLTAESTCDVFSLSFYTGCTKWNSAAIRNVLLFMASLFIGFLVEKYVTCQSRKSDFGWHRFRFSPCLMRKRVAKSEAILALLDTFQGCISNGKPE